MDPVRYAFDPTYQSFVTGLSSSDEAFEGFCAGCAQAGTQGCAFAKAGSTAASLNQDVRDLIDVSLFFSVSWGFYLSFPLL